MDKRSDIWSFGVVFYEMLTGRKLFTGETGSDILAAVLARDIDLSALPGSTPLWLTHLLARCLERDKKKRLRDIGDAFLNENLAPAVARVSAPEPPRRSWTLAAAAAGIALAAGGLAGWAFRSNGATGAEIPVHAFSFSPAMLGESDLVRRAAVSPDGKQIAYVAAGKIWIRSLANETPVAVEGSENGEGPFWSPDSRQVAFGAELELRKAAIASGGRTSKVSRLSAGYRGGAWSLDGASIMMGTVDGGLVEAPANGGYAKVVVAPGKGAGNVYYSPQYLPSPPGKRLAVASRGSRNQQTMLLIDLTTGKQETIGDGAYPCYSQTGHILYQPGARRQGVWAAPYSAENGRITGEAFSVRESGTDASSSASGSLVWLDNNTFAERQLVWKDRQGRRLGVAGMPAPSVRGLAVSPDFTRASFATETQGNSDIWIQDLGSNRRTRFTFHPQNDVYAVWSPGSDIVFASSRLSNLNIEMFIQGADGSGEPKRIAGSPGRPQFASSWSTDGLTVLINYQGPKTGPDIWYIHRNPDGSFGEAKPFLESPFDEQGAQFSPDAKWVAYESDESGRAEIYVRQFPGGGGKRQISVRGGSDPRWRRDGKEIFFLTAETLFAVPVSWNGGSPLQAGDAVELFHSPGVRAGRFAGGQYDVTRDGQRFLLFEPTEADAAKPPGIHVVSNWLSARPR